MRQEDFVIEEPEKIDIWALGLILYEMIGYCHPFVHKDTPKDRTYEDIRDNQLKFDGSLWSDVGQEGNNCHAWKLYTSIANNPLFFSERSDTMVSQEGSTRTADNQ